MSRRKNEVTVSEPKLVGKIYYVTLSYRKPGSAKRSKTRYSTGETERSKAHQKGYNIRDDFQTHLHSKQLSASDKQPLGECVEHYLSRKRAKAWALATEREYRAILERFTAFAHTETPVCNITSDLCEEFFSEQTSPHQSHKAYRVLSAFFNELVPRKLPFSAVAGLGKKLRPKKVIQDYFHEELNEFAEFYRRIPEGSYTERAFKYFCALAYGTGVRLTDLSLLRESDFNFQHGIIIVRVQGKTGFPVQCLISNQVAEAIHLQLRNKAGHEDSHVRNSEYLFPNVTGEPFSKYFLSKRFHAIRCELLPNRPGLHTHSLRHSFGQNSLNFGVPLAEISYALGHTNQLVTGDNYAQNARFVRVQEHYSTLRDYLNSRPILSRLEPIA